MGSTFGIVADDVTIRFSLYIPLGKGNQVLEAGKKLSIFKDVLKNGSTHKMFFLFEDSINAFIQRDVNVFQNFRDLIIENLPQNLESTIHISGSEAEYNKELMDKIEQIVQIKEIKFQHSKILNSLTNAMHYLIARDDMIYNFTNPMDILQLSSIKTVVPDLKYCSANTIQYPYLLVNLRGGVSFYYVENQDKFNRLQGSIIGESMLEGLTSQLSFQNNDGDNSTNQKEKDLNEILMEAYIKGDNKKVDMTVGDIYGQDTASLGLPPDLLASSMGKLAKAGNTLSFTQYDVIRSLTNSLAVNLGLLTSLTAKLYPDLKTAVFVYWTIESQLFNYIIQCFVDYYSKNTLNSYFVQKSTYLSAMGVTIQQNNQ